MGGSCSGHFPGRLCNQRHCQIRSQGLSFIHARQLWSFPSLRARAPQRPYSLHWALQEFHRTQFLADRRCSRTYFPLMGGGKKLAFRHDRRTGQLIADHLLRHGLPPDKVLAQQAPSSSPRTSWRKAMDAGPPNWLYNLMIGTSAVSWFARQVDFHRQKRAG